MGTRSTTKVYEFEGEMTPALMRKLKPLLAIYRQFDGYPEGHGADLADFFKGMTIVNGIGMGETIGTHANGAGCFAAQLVKQLKETIGNIYIVSSKNDNEEYNYHIYLRARDRGSFGTKPCESLIWVRVANYAGRKIFSGPRDEYVEWIKKRLMERPAALKT